MADKKTHFQRAEELADRRERLGPRPPGCGEDDDDYRKWRAAQDPLFAEYSDREWSSADDILRRRGFAAPAEPQAPEPQAPPPAPPPPPPPEDDEPDADNDEDAEDTVSVAEATAWDETDVKLVRVGGKRPSDFSRACHGLTPTLRFAQDALSGELLTKRGDEPWRIPDRAADATHQSLFKESVVVVTTRTTKAGTEEVEKPWAISEKEWSGLRAGEAGLNRQNDFEDYVRGCEVSDNPDAPTIGDLFFKAFGCSDTLLNRETSSLLMRAMVRRGCLMDGENGTMFDYCPILAGPQGTAKTKGLPLLFPEHLRATRTTSNALLMGEEKEFVRSISGMVLAIADEMAGRTKADREALKARITRASDRVRPHYRNATEHRVRTAVVCATANPGYGGFIPDDQTGLRRWIPIIVPRPEKGALETPLDRAKKFFDRWRDHLWAAALSAAEVNRPLLLSTAADAEANVLRDHHETQVDAPFVGWLKDEAERVRRNHAEGIQIDELLFRSDGEPRTKTIPRSNRARSQALQQAGYRHAQVRIEGRVKRVWIPPAPSGSHPVRE